MSSHSEFLLSVVIPCYNSQDYMAGAVDSVLAAESDAVEILIVNDGSVDRTAEIAGRFAQEHPNNIRVINQENKGHGGAVNSGIHAASGRYLKVLDSDDWFDLSALQQVLALLERFANSKAPVDLLITNYVYEKVGAKKNRSMNYTNVFPGNRILSWDDIGSFRLGQYLMMHSLIYRTEVLRQSGLDLPEHTFYVDNLFVNLPLAYVRSLYYLDVDLYRYYIGREDQSVNEQVMIRRIDQQLRVNRLMLENLLASNVEFDTVRRLLFHHFEIVTIISSVLLIKAGDRASLDVKDQWWNEIYQANKSLYWQLRRRPMGFLVTLHGKIGKAISLVIYGLAQKIFKFN